MEYILAVRLPAAKEWGNLFEHIHVPTDSILNCPIKLPPLDPSCLDAAPGQSPAPTAGSGDKRATVDKGEFKDLLSELRKTPPHSRADTSLTPEEKAGREFEAFMISLVFKQAFSNQLSEGIFGNSYASKMYFDMFIDAAAEETAKSSPLGIADLIVADINRRTTTE